MMVFKNNVKGIQSVSGLFLAVLLSGCGSTVPLVSTPVANIDTVPLKVMDLTEDQEKTWGHADLVADTIPGLSLNKAYTEVIKDRKGKTVTVAVIDSGIDIDHEDLNDVLWTNKGERPGNGIDDDKNGYVDDVHGYNFLGTSYNEQLEQARMLRLNVGGADMLAKAKADVEENYAKALQNKQQYEGILQTVKQADQSIQKVLGKETYTKEEVAAIKPQDDAMKQNVSVIMQMYQYGDSIEDVKEELKGGIDYFTDQANYNYNAQFDGRKEVGDNPYDLNSLGYGNGDPRNIKDDESHGTHVAGIIAAERNNGKGMNGVANNVRIMSLRAVPNGDEYDKDIALAIRYAADNGAKVINCSFGKSFSPNANWVHDAIKYANSKDVLIVHAAGNSGEDLDNPNNPNYPNDHAFSGSEIAPNVITVGALAPKYGSEMLASFSNYGSQNVDVFAPGKQIYSTVPDNKYEFNSGTSMAAPAVAGVAALIRSYYPNLKAKQVKQIIMQSGLSSKADVILGGDTANSKGFAQASKSGKMVNAYNALILAENYSKGKATLSANGK